MISLKAFQQNAVDSAVELFTDLKARMQVRHIHVESISRADAVGRNDQEGLIKRGVKAIAWRVEGRGPMRWLILKKTALRDAAQLHTFLSELKRAGINLTPLMLVAALYGL